MGKECVICGDTFQARISSYSSEFRGQILCNKHSLQIKRNGSIVDPTPSKRRVIRICEVCGSNQNVLQCGFDGEYRGTLLCSKHYKQIQYHNKITDPHIPKNNLDRVCSICNAIEDILYYPETGVMLCRRHYNQMKKYGKILKRTASDRNEIVMKDTYAEMILYNQKNEEINRTIIDIEYIEILSNYKWGFDSTWGYVSTRFKINEKIVYVYLQDFLMDNYGDNRKVIIDHINRNPLDNRKLNLRPSNKSLNGLNISLRKNNSSGVTGVSYSEKLRKWRSYINLFGTRKDLGSFETYEDAVFARLFAEAEHLKNYSPQQHLFDKYGIVISGTLEVK